MAGFKDDKAGETCPTNRLIGLLLVLVLANVWVHHARKSNNENGFERTRVRGTPIPSLPPAEEEHDDFQEWHSAWELNHPSIIRDCKPIEDMMMAAENSGKAPLEGKVLGYEKKPGKVGHCSEYTPFLVCTIFKCGLTVFLSAVQLCFAHIAA